MPANNVEPVGIELLGNFRDAAFVLSVFVVFNSEEGIDLVADFVCEEEVAFGEDLTADVEDEHVSKSEFVFADNCAVVPGQIMLVVLEIHLQSVVGVAVLALVAGSKSEAGVGEGLGEVEGGVEVPLFVPFLDDAVVEVDLDVVGGLDLGVEGAALGEVEPVLDLVGDFVAAFVGFDVDFEVDDALGSFGVDLGGEEFVVDEVVGEDGVGLLGPLGPGVVFDAFGL